MEPGWPTARTRVTRAAVTRRDLGIRPYVALGLAVMAVSSSALLIRLSTAPPVVVASYRMAFVTILLAPLALHFQRQDFGQLRGLNLWRLLAAGACLALHFACWTASLQFTSVASSVVLVSTHPMFVAIAESVWLRRPISRVGLAGIALSMFGGQIGRAHV